jgi:uncharacterized protein
MHPAIPKSQAAIAQLCQSLAVRQLDLFGSAATGDAQRANDFDFLVELDSHAHKSQARRMIELADGLEALLGSEVDVMSIKSVRNPYFAEQVQASRQNVYVRT